MAAPERYGSADDERPGMCGAGTCEAGSGATGAGGNPERVSRATPLFSAAEWGALASDRGGVAWTRLLVYGLLGSGLGTEAGTCPVECGVAGAGTTGARPAEWGA